MSHGLLRSAPLACGVLHIASLLVPAGERRLWLAEWNAELCHLCSRCGAQPFARDRLARQALQYSLGAFPDAWYLRSAQLAPLLSLLRPGSASRCALLLAAAAALSLMATMLLPSARDALLSASQAGSGKIELISAAGYAGTERPSVRLDQYRSWGGETDRIFADLAFYRLAVSRVHLDHTPTVSLTLAVATPNLLRLLGIRPDPGSQPRSARGGSRLFLSRSAWQRCYGSDPQVLGRTAIVAGAPVHIAGIVQDDEWPLPNRMDAWLLEDQREFDQGPAAAKGFALARVRDDLLPPGHSGWPSLIDDTGDKSLRFDCISLKQIARQPVSVFLLALLLACMALPATTALPLGDYPARRGPLSGAAHLRRWSFLSLKFLLVICAVYFCSVDGAYGFGQTRSSTAVYLQLAIAFPALLFAFRWILQDQRRRCPVCLRLLSNPARVGQASCNFLAWSGTELFCASGHGLLHIPELPTSWFSRQRWLCLDPSWLALFPCNDSAPAGLG